MSKIDRRGSIRLAMAGAIASSLSVKAGAQQIANGGLIAPPDSPMLYRRVVERDLIDGQSFRVTRNFHVVFSAIAEGYLLQGRQTAVSVEAPEALARFRALEEERDETGLFPIALNAFGQIQSPNPEPFGARQVEAAITQALAALEQLPMPESEREQARRFVSALHSAGQGITAVMPHDLFAPSGMPRRTEQLVALPDGVAGRVETVFDGQLDARTGLMSAAMREIVTAVDGSRRMTREEWSLAPA